MKLNAVKWAGDCQSFLSGEVMKVMSVFLCLLFSLPSAAKRGTASGVFCMPDARILCHSGLQEWDVFISAKLWRRGPDWMFEPL